jgi:glycosyltransferase involved in cell wall biosynthesis
MMKVLYVVDRNDPRDHNSGSGLDYDIFQVFEKSELEVSVVGPFERQLSRVDRLWRKLMGQFTTRSPRKYTKSYLKNASAQVEQAIQKVDPDVIFAKAAAPLSYCRITKPLVYSTDTTLIGQQKQWPVYTRSAYREMLSWESRVVVASSQVLTYSKWSADVLQAEYHIPPEKIAYFALPDSLPEDVIPSEIHLEDKVLDPIRLLLVGRTYHRKGIDIAVQVVALLNQRGYPAELRVVGLSGEAQAHTRFMGLYNKTIPEELTGYVSNYQWAHFLIHPARFEAAGIVPSEAAAFGVPTITNDVGGLGTTVKDGVSGIVLPFSSPAEAYVDALLPYIQDREAYLHLCRSTKERHTQELNWYYAGEQILSAIRRAAGGK